MMTTLSAWPPMASGSGDMTGIFLSFVLVPVAGLWSLIVVAAKFQGILAAKIALGVFSVPVAIALYIAVDLGATQLIPLSEYRGRHIWPALLGAIAAGLFPFLAVRFLNRMLIARAKDTSRAHEQ